MAVNVRERKLPGGGTHWQTDIRVRLPSGRLYRERLKAPASTRAQAMRWARQREAYILRNGLDRDVVAGGARCPTLREFMPRFMADYVAANRLKPATRRNWEQAWTHHLLPLFGRSRLAEIGPADIQRLKRQPVAPGTVNLLLGKLGTVLRVAREWGLIAEVPRIKKVKEPTKRPRFYDLDEYRRLIESARACGPQTLAIILLAGDAGLRTGEIIALRWRDVDARRGALTVARNVCRGHEGSPKGGRVRQVPMTPRLKQTLAGLDRVGGRVLLREDGAMITTGVITSAMYRAQRGAGLPKTGAHILRHTFCSHLAMKGAAPRAIQGLAGHAKSATTDKYMHLAPRALRSAIDLLDADVLEPATERQGDAGSRRGRPRLPVNPP